MITLINRDSYIYDLEYRIIDIIDEYIRTGEIEIDMNYEGTCLREVKLYDILDYICDRFNLDKSKVTIYSDNILESHDQYNIDSRLSHFLNDIPPLLPQEYVINKNTKLKTLGSFSGRPIWNRLIMISWLWSNYRDQCLLTFNYNGTDPDIAELDLNRLNFIKSNELQTSVEFLKHTPLLLDEKYKTTNYDINNVIGEPFFKMSLTLLPCYADIFAELILETYTSGNTFFPTEKTLRPIFAKTPFIVLGPRDYLKNLRRLGFKTFNRWWNEDYDYCEGALRIDEMKKVIADVMTWSQERIQDTLIEMQEVLDYNYNHLMSNTEWALK